MLGIVTSISVLSVLWGVFQQKRDVLPGVSPSWSVGSKDIALDSNASFGLDESIQSLTLDVDDSTLILPERIEPYGSFGIDDSFYVITVASSETMMPP